MNRRRLAALLETVRSGDLPVGEAVDLLRDLPYGELAEAKVDNHRELRQGYPEVVLCQGKTKGQVREILGYMIRERSHNVLATRAGADLFAAASDLHPDLRYNALGRTLVLQREPVAAPEGGLAIVTAGTSDLPVAEAFETASLFGARVERINDVGVAGLHRLVGHLPVLRRARVLIVIAGMEGRWPAWWPGWWIVRSSPFPPASVTGPASGAWRRCSGCSTAAPVAWVLSISTTAMVPPALRD